MNGKRMTLGALCFVLCAVGIAFAQGPRGFGPPDGPGGPGGPFPGLMKYFIAEFLELTPVQKVQIHSVMKSYRPQIQERMEKIGEAHKLLRDAIHADEFDEAKVRAASKGVAQQKEEMDVLRAEIVSKIRPLLNEQQVAKAKHFLENMPGPGSFPKEDEGLE